MWPRIRQEVKGCLWLPSLDTEETAMSKVHWCGSHFFYNEESFPIYIFPCCMFVNKDSSWTCLQRKFRAVYWMSYFSRLSLEILKRLPINLPQLTWHLSAPAFFLQHESFPSCKTKAEPFIYFVILWWLVISQNRDKSARFLLKTSP